MNIPEYSEFDPISVGYLHPEIRSFKKERWKTQWSNLQHPYSILPIDERSRAFIHASTQFHEEWTSLIFIISFLFTLDFVMIIITALWAPFTTDTSAIQNYIFIINMYRPFIAHWRRIYFTNLPLLCFLKKHEIRKAMVWI